MTEKPRLTELFALDSAVFESRTAAAQDRYRLAVREWASALKRTGVDSAFSDGIIEAVEDYKEALDADLNASSERLNAGVANLEKQREQLDEEVTTALRKYAGKWFVGAFFAGAIFGAAGVLLGVYCDSRLAARDAIQVTCRPDHGGMSCDYWKVQPTEPAATLTSEASPGPPLENAGPASAPRVK